MRTPTHHRGLVVTVSGAGLLALGIALAMANKPTADKPKPRARPTASKGALDCKMLEQQLSKCGPAIAAAFDAGLGARLAKQPAHLREATLRAISAEFVSQVANPCYSFKGKVDQGAEIQACLTAAAAQAKAAPCKSKAASARCRTARQIARCRAFAKCLAQKIRALPRPKKAKGAKATPLKTAGSDKKPAAMKGPPSERPAPKKK